MSFQRITRAHPLWVSNLQLKLSHTTWTLWVSTIKPHCITRLALIPFINSVLVVRSKYCHYYLFRLIIIAHAELYTTIHTRSSRNHLFKKWFHNYNWNCVKTWFQLCAHLFNVQNGLIYICKTASCCHKLVCRNSLWRFVCMYNIASF